MLEIHVEEESSWLCKESFRDLLKLLESKFFQALSFACYIVKPDDLKKFVEGLTLSETIFILCLHGLINEDVTLCAAVAEVLHTDKQFYDGLRFFTPEFEFWARCTFKLRNFHVRSALAYSCRIRNSKLFLTPKSVYRILRGYVSVIGLNPSVRDKLFEYNKEKPKDVSSYEPEIDKDFEKHALAITTAEDEEEEDNECSKYKSKKILFVRKEPIDLKILGTSSKHWHTLSEKFEELLKPRVLAALKFSCNASIYGKEFTLKALEAPYERHFLLWLFGLLHRDIVIFSLTCNWFAFSVINNKTFPPNGFKEWLDTTFMFPKNRLLSGARYLRKIKFTDLFYIVPSMEEIFIAIPLIQTKPSMKFTLKDITEGKVKKIRGKKKKKVKINPIKSVDIELSETVLLEENDPKTNFAEQLQEYASISNNIGLSNFSYPRSYPFEECTLSNLQNHFPSLYSTSYEEMIDQTGYNLYNANSVGQSTINMKAHVPSPPAPVFPWRVQGASNICISAESKNFHSTLTEHNQAPSLSYFPPFKNKCINESAVWNGIQLTASQKSGHAEKLDCPQYDSPKIPIIRTIAEGTLQDIPEPPPPPILTRMDSPTPMSSDICNKHLEVGENEESSIESILKYLEQRDKVINDALLKAAGEGRTEDLTKLVAASSGELLKKAVGGSSGESLLHLAAKGDHESAVEFLLEQGLDLERKDTSGRTALHTAIANGRSTIVEILLEAGASACAMDNEGRTPYQLAIALGKNRLARKLAT